MPSSNRRTHRRSRSLSARRLSPGLEHDPLSYENLTGMVTQASSAEHNGRLGDYVHEFKIRGRTVSRGGLVRIGSMAYKIGSIIQHSRPTSYTFSVYPAHGEYRAEYFRYAPAHGGARRRSTRRRR